MPVISSSVTVVVVVVIRLRKWNFHFYFAIFLCVRKASCVDHFFESGSYSTTVAMNYTFLELNHTVAGIDWPTVEINSNGPNDTTINLDGTSISINNSTRIEINGTSIELNGTAVEINGTVASILCIEPALFQHPKKKKTLELST